MICVSLTRFITDHMHGLGIGITHRMMSELDFPCILIPLFEEKPWIRTTDKGEEEVYEDQAWKPRDSDKIPKIEA